MSINIPTRPRRLDDDLFASGDPCDAYTTRTLVRNVNHFFSEGKILVNKVWPETHPDFNLSGDTDRGMRYVNHARDREMIIGGFSCSKTPCNTLAQMSIRLHVADTKTIKIQASSLGQEYDPSFPIGKAMSYTGVGAYETNVDYFFLLKKGSDRENIKIHLQGTDWQTIRNAEYSSTAAAGCSSGNISLTGYAFNVHYADYVIMYIDSSSTPNWRTGSSNATISDGSCFALLQDAGNNTVASGMIVYNDADTMHVKIYNGTGVSGYNTPMTKYKIFQPVTTLISNILIKEIDISSYL